MLRMGASLSRAASFAYAEAYHAFVLGLLLEGMDPPVVSLHAAQRAEVAVGRADDARHSGDRFQGDGVMIVLVPEEARHEPLGPPHDAAGNVVAKRSRFCGRAWARTEGSARARRERARLRACLLASGRSSDRSRRTVVSLSGDGR